MSPPTDASAQGSDRGSNQGSEPDSEPDSDLASDRGRAVKLSCRNLWKIYGAGAESFLEKTGGAPSADDLRQAGLIGALRNVSLDIHDREIFVIMGLSGSGKSTLVRNLSLLVQPTAGEVRFDGRDLMQVSARELMQIRRHKMGMVFQNFALLPHLTVLQNVTFPLEIQGIDRGKREARAREVITLVGLEGREDYYPRELSGGQQQRVGIARSLAVEPELWFLDEPFSALDPLIRRDMQNEFLRLQSLLNKTIVFITHDFDEAMKLADRMAILKDGAIEQMGTPEDLVLNPATDYVAEFTRDVDKQKVVRVRSIMQRGDTGPADGPTLRAEALIGKVAARILGGGDQRFAVENGDGRRVGTLLRRDALKVLFDEAQDD